MEFKDHTSLAKHNIRENLLVQLFKLDKEELNILTLPSTNFIFEKMVKKYFPLANIDCMEIDKSIYKKMKNNLPVKVNYECGDIFDKINNSPLKYDFIWMDLCGCLTFSIFNNVISLTQNCLKDSIIALTLLSAREYRINHFLEKYNCSDQNEFRQIIFPNIITKHAQLKHKDFQCSNIIKYKNDRTHSSPMTLYIFQTKNFIK